jgi:transposase
LAELRQIKGLKANPMLEKIKQWIEQHIYQTTPDSKIGRAIKYTLGNRNQRSGYVKGGKLEIDNNLAENKINPNVIRNNGL